MKIIALMGKARILDDLTAILKRDTSHVIGVDSPRKLILGLEEDIQIDMVIADANLLYDSEVDVLNFIQSRQRYHWLPILATCHDCEPEKMMSLVRRGVHDILIYPFDPDRFYDRVKNAHLNGRRKIVVIDDEPGILEILTDIFELERHVVYPFSCAEGAFAFLKENQNVHAVVSDILLPGASGIDVLKTVKAKYSNIPVILITGQGGKFAPEKLMAIGADGYFNKPFHNVDLIRTLFAILHKYGRYNKKNFQPKIQAQPA
jgi:DNA-binding NtrC family response regulator